MTGSFSLKSEKFSGLPILGALQGGVWGELQWRRLSQDLLAALREDWDPPPPNYSQQPTFQLIPVLWSCEIDLAWKVFPPILNVYHFSPNPQLPGRTIPSSSHQTSFQLSISRTLSLHSCESNVLKSERFFLFNFQVFFPSQFLWRTNIHTVTNQLSNRLVWRISLLDKCWASMTVIFWGSLFVVVDFLSH